jgi:copper resistance protein B
LLLTQKLITQPYIEADVIFSDDSNYAAKSGLSELKTGIKTRYEITKRIKPFIDVAYQYEKGQKATLCKRLRILKKAGNMVQASN